MEKSIINFIASKKAAPSSSSSAWSDISNIPLDVLVNIVKRLPLKNITRLTCVNKSWHSLLTCHTFISAHLCSTNNHPTYKYHLFRRPPSVHFNATFFIVNRRLSNYNHRCIIQCPVADHTHIVVASSDGLFCLCDYLNTRNPDSEPITLWNPYTRKTRLVPVSLDGMISLTFDARGFPMLIFGFGYDYTSSTYKLLRVPYFNVTGYGSPGIGTYFQTQIYDLGLKTWRRITDVVNMSLNVYSIKWRGWYFNGVIHWACSFHSNDNKICWTILTFNLGTEQYSEIKLPKEAMDSMNKTVSLVMIPNGSKEVLGVVNSTSDVLSLWVMEQYGVEESWVKLFDFEHQNMFGDDINVGILDEDHIIFQISSSGWVSYNIRSQKVTGQTPPGWAYYYAGTHMENLLLLG